MLNAWKYLFSVFLTCTFSVNLIDLNCLLCIALIWCICSSHCVSFSGSDCCTERGTIAESECRTCDSRASTGYVYLFVLSYFDIFQWMFTVIIVRYWLVSDLKTCEDVARFAKFSEKTSAFSQREMLENAFQFELLTFLVWRTSQVTCFKMLSLFSSYLLWIGGVFWNADH